MIKKWIKISILLATITSTTMGLISCGNSVTNTSGNNIESSEQAQVLNDGSKLKLAKNEDGTVTIDETMCNGCGLCMKRCKFDAIGFEPRNK